jgi:hypothetical protein
MIIDIERLKAQTLAVQTTGCATFPLPTDLILAIIERLERAEAANKRYSVCMNTSGVDDLYARANSANARVKELEAAGQRQPVAVSVWQAVTKPGQVKVGDKLRFTIGDDKYSATATLILHAGTDAEEIIYNKRKNYYLITSMAIANRGSQKSVEFLSAALQPVTPPAPASGSIGDDAEFQRLLNETLQACFPSSRDHKPAEKRRALVAHIDARMPHAQPVQADALDAARYRWLRSSEIDLGDFCDANWGREFEAPDGVVLDAIVDAAMAGSKA